MPHSHPVDDRDRPYALLAEHLLSLRCAARLTQRALAEVANISRGAIQRAESGTAAPSLPILSAYIRACRGDAHDLARAKDLRNRGRAAARNRLGALNAPALDHIRTCSDLAAALASVYERAGAPSLREFGPYISATTAWRIANGKSLPTTGEQLHAFLMVCGVSAVERTLYVNAHCDLRAADLLRSAMSARPPRRVGRDKPTLVGTTGQDDRYTRRAAISARRRSPAVVSHQSVTGVAEMARRERQFVVPKPQIPSAIPDHASIERLSRLLSLRGLSSEAHPHSPTTAPSPVGRTARSG
ncbi:helix-turn-helix transcriptional regulator [Streptomyces sp. NPDC044780]|uniref:helix-turn-helix domain-containing protein n=1 Tax=unclassified Streptomyces TaxID=2593676 RepID=UPI0033D4E26F